MCVVRDLPSVVCLGFELLLFGAPAHVLVVLSLRLEADAVVYDNAFRHDCRWNGEQRGEGESELHTISIAFSLRENKGVNRTLGVVETVPRS